MELTRPSRDGEKAFLEQAVVEGIRGAVIAEAWGVSRQRIQQMAKTYGIAFPRRLREEFKPAIEPILCPNCGEQFTPPRKRQKQAKYCSQRCTGEAKRGGKSSRHFKITLVCDGCGVTHERTLYQHNISTGQGSEHNYCSHQCYIDNRLRK